jgi:phosphoglucomutase
MLAAYQGSMEQLFTGFAAAETRGELMQRMGQAVQRGRPGIVIDFNGGARATSIDAGFLRGLGAQSFAINKTPGSIAHTIVPEGDALTQCSQTLTALRSKGLGYSLGYVTDNDGDRGNLVFHDSAADAVRPLHAQELFALVCMVELAWMVKTGRLTYDENGRAHQKVAVAVNGPTSLRVERIARAFDAEVYRAEVGEANVVSLARTLRRRGYLVRILGEGSNGGCIIEPAEVRDPLGTIGALIKLLYTPDLRGVDIRARADDEELDAGRGPTEEDLEADLFRIWCKRSGRLEQYRSDYGLADVLATLPAFRTTGAYEERAKLQVEEAHGPLKEAYEALFHRRWKELQKQFTDRLDLYLWEEINYEGTDERHGVGRAMRSGSQRGGFKILFKNRSGRPVGYLWMRGSGTEPVFRVVTDVEGSDEQLEQELHRWHVALIREAAQAAGHAGWDRRSGQS